MTQDRPGNKARGILDGFRPKPKPLPIPPPAPKPVKTPGAAGILGSYLD